MQKSFRLDKRQVNEKIVIFGLGHFAGDIINRMIDRRKNLNFAIADENKEVLNSCKAPLKIFPHEIHDFKKFFADNFYNTDMIFIVDVFGEFKDFALKLAYAAKSSGALTIGIPVQNKEIDETDFQKFKDYSDSVILSCANDNEFPDVPIMIIEGITTLITEHGKFNVNFLGIKNVLFNSGTVFFGTGYAEGENKSIIAARKALDVCRNIIGAKSILVNFTADCYTSLASIHYVARYIDHSTDNDTQVIWGHIIDENMLNSIRVTLIMSMHDNGYVSYDDMFQHESYEKLSSFVKNGITPVMKLRLGSEESFFASGLIYGSLEIIRLFIACGYDPKSLENDGIFPDEILEGIIRRNDAVEILNILFASGITLSDNLVRPILEAKTPEVYKVFANYGWNVNSHTDDKMTVLTYAVQRLRVEYVKTLIELGADVEFRDDEGRTPLMRLISNLQGRYYMHNSYDCLQKLKLLLDNGADILAVDNEGKNALGEYIKK